MSDKYCPLMDGECERKTIRKYCKPFDDQPDEFIANYESCPWPSRQVPVKQEPLSDCDKCQKDDALAAIDGLMGDK